MRSAGATKNCFRLQKDVACGEVGFFQSLQHGGDGHSTDVGAVLMLRSERDREQACILDVVDADDADLFGDANSTSCETLHDAGGGDVVGADDCVGMAFFEDGLEEVRIFRVAETYEVLLRMNSAGEESLAIACDASVDSGG